MEKLRCPECGSGRYIEDRDRRVDHRVALRGVWVLLQFESGIRHTESDVESRQFKPFDCEDPLSRAFLFDNPCAVRYTLRAPALRPAIK